MNYDTSSFPKVPVFCIDSKSFYASVECVRRGLNPLETYMVVIGDASRSGSVVLAASPKMKAEYGIKTGSRYYEVPRDPKIHIIEASMSTYLEFFYQLNQILYQLAPPECIYEYSIDESLMVYDSKLYGSNREAAKMIQDRIAVELGGLVVAIGIGENYFQSKICLDVLAKHNADNDFIAEVSYDDFAEKLWGTPLRSVWGIGSRMERNLNRMGAYNLGDLARRPVERLRKRFGIMGDQLHNHAHGIDLSDPYHRPQLHRNEPVQKA
ncbi:nucleotidyltransferase/DNA polymerase involved in DNA repair [Paenibacillus mucilaginosus]|uniref:Y-family DNA polymerase n=1 Tax=Paenibacillus mucilaginosus TaxID=61624 RepID=UPI003D21999A